MILGNKCDLTYLKNVDAEECHEKAKTLGCDFMEVSCVELDSVREAFRLLIAKIFYNELPETKKNYFRILLSKKSEGEVDNREENIDGFSNPDSYNTKQESSVQDKNSEEVMKDNKSNSNGGFLFDKKSENK